MMLDIATRDCVDSEKVSYLLRASHLLGEIEMGRRASALHHGGSNHCV